LNKKVPVKLSDTLTDNDVIVTVTVASLSMCTVSPNVVMMMSPYFVRKKSDDLFLVSVLKSDDLL